ncbi:MAG: PRC-barrel domain-containing protein [Candidatus Pacearchaeota archaeon]
MLKMLKLRRISDVIGLPVYTDAGEFVGEVEELSIFDNRIDSWKIKVAKNSTLTPQVGGAKGIIIPHKYIRAVGDIVIISKSITPQAEEEKIEIEFE